MESRLMKKVTYTLVNGKKTKQMEKVLVTIIMAQCMMDFGKMICSKAWALTFMKMVINIQENGRKMNKMEQVYTLIDPMEVNKMESGNKAKCTVKVLKLKLMVKNGN